MKAGKRLNEFDQTSIYEIMQVEKILVGKVPVAVYRPEGFVQGKKYPVWLFMHGQGEMSTQSATLDALTSNIVSNGNHANLIAKAEKEGWIVVAPLLVQALNNWTPGWTNTYLQPVYDYILKADFTDLSQIKVTGLSLGGGGVWVCVTGGFAPYISAAIPICGTPEYDNDFSVVAKNNIPVWAFHAKDDKTINVVATTNIITAIKKSNPTPQPKVTLYDTGGHFIWGRVYLDDEMYAWAMAQSNDGVVTQPPITEPTDELLYTIQTKIYKSGKIDTVRI